MDGWGWMEVAGWLSGGLVRWLIGHTGVRLIYQKVKLSTTSPLKVQFLRSEDGTLHQTFDFDTNATPYTFD